MRGFVLESRLTLFSRKPTLMRPLEITLFFSFILALLGPWFWRARWAVALWFVPVVVALAQWAVEQPRWQLSPAYGLAGLLAGVGIAQLGRPAQSQRKGHWAWTVAGLVLVGLLAAPGLIFPVPQLPTPTGPYPVGTISYQWNDSKRLEAYTADPADTRQIMVQFFYPAIPAPGAQPGPWMDQLEVVGPIVARYIRLPSFALDHARLAQTNSYPAAPLAPAPGQFPIVVYSHGWNGFRTINMNQAEELASRGFVVVTIDHTYGAMFTVFADGQVALNEPSALPDGAHDAAWQARVGQLAATYAGDITFVLDQLEQVQQGTVPTPFAGRLDLNRIGVFGYSTGGGGMLLACASDPRCRVLLGQDPWAEPLPAAALTASVSQPLFVMSSETWSHGDNVPFLAQITANATGPVTHIHIAGTKHYDFTLIPLLSPLTPWLGLKGPLEGSRTLHIITTYTADFFSAMLQNVPSALLDGPVADYPEVTFGP